jgi:ATP-dependent Clp protease ATP-binding subunit ClpX
LDLETLIAILTKPKNALIKQYEKLFELEGIKLTFTQEAIEFVSQKALEYKLGARGLRSLCEAILTDAMFELPSLTGITEFVVDLAYAEEKVKKTAKHKLMAA